MLDLSKTYVYDRKEYKLTGRMAEASDKNKVPRTLLEIAPVNNVDNENETLYNKWVLAEDLYIVRKINNEK